MRKKYRALDRRVLEMEKVVDRCLKQHGSHLHDSNAASIRAKSVRYAEGLLCMMNADELAGSDAFSAAICARVAVEIEGHTVKAISEAAGPMSILVN